MVIAARPLIGDSISYAKNEILEAIAKGKFPDRGNWYAITSAYEENNLFYILSAREFHNPIYHLPGKDLKLFGIAGTKGEAREIVVSLVQQSVDSNSLPEIKRSLETC
ncbi:MAG: hypothetical protein IKX76_06815 [Eubacterium sp.]|nr:hypothetical protein [Eubacterium sp.]